jgi:hypothetical protein
MVDGGFDEFANERVQVDTLMVDSEIQSIDSMRIPKKRHETSRNSPYALLPL